jgi:hypothetical protein
MARPVGFSAAILRTAGGRSSLPTIRQIDARRQHSRRLLPDAHVIAATFALQQALPAARSGDQASLDDGLLGYR